MNFWLSGWMKKRKKKKRKKKIYGGDFITCNIYEVKSTGGFALRIVAKNSTQAKRIYCRKTNRRPSDLFCGIKSLTAKKVN